MKGAKFLLSNRILWLLTTKVLSSLLSGLSLVLVIKSTGIKDFTIFGICLNVVALGTTFIEFGQTQKSIRSQIQGRVGFGLAKMFQIRILIASLVFILFVFYMVIKAIPAAIYAPFLAVFVVSILMILTANAYATENFKLLALSNLFQGLSFFIMSLIGFVMSRSIVWFVYSYNVSLVIQAFYMFLVLRNQGKLGFNFREIFDVTQLRKLKTEINQGLPYFGTTLMTALIYKGFLIYASFRFTDVDLAILIVASKFLDFMFILPGTLVPYLIARYSKTFVNVNRFSLIITKLTISTLTILAVCLLTSPLIMRVFNLNNLDNALIIFLLVITCIIPYSIECAAGAIHIAEGRVTEVLRSGALSVILLLVGLFVLYLKDLDNALPSLSWLLAIQTFRAMVLVRSIFETRREIQ